MDHELVYLDLRGRAEAIRLMLTLAGLPFTDTRIPYPEWPAHKSRAPIGQVPYLVVRDGDQVTTIPQSFAILRHLGRVHGFYGATEAERVQCDVVGDALADLRASYVFVRFGPGSKDPAAVERFFSEQLPLHIGRLTTLLAGGPGAFFVAETPTWADVAVFDGLDAVSLLRPSALDAAPELQAFVDRMRAIPAIGRYLAERPEGNR